MREKKTKLSMTQKLFLFIAIIMTLHYFDWAFFRPYPRLLMLGFLVAFALNSMLAILLPMMTNEKEWEIKNLQLEEAIRERIEQYKESERLSREKDERMAAVDIAYKAKSLFLANMSHEIRTPLNSVIGLTEILLDSKLNEEQRRLVKVANAAGENLLYLINDILELSRIETGNLLLEVVPFSPSDLLKEPMEKQKAIGKQIENKKQDVLTAADDRKILQILVADDSKDNRLVIELFLRGEYQLLTQVENGKEAVEAFKKQKFDIVFMDIQMPVMDGYTATREIRKWELESGRVQTPILALTAHAFEEDVQASKNAGCAEHITKPLTKIIFLEILGKYSKISIT